MDQSIRYTVTATDLLSGKIQGMQARAQGLEGTLASVGTTASSMGSKLMSGLGMLGIGFSAFKGFSLISEGVEKVEQLHQAQAQVKAGLESTGYAAGVTAASLDTMAKSFGASTKYSRAEITDLQSLMLTFPAITKDTFPQATQAILDMSTRLGQDTKSSAIQLGKALQDPIRGITALRRVGVNFNDSQKEVIANLVATGQTAKAQTIILAELTNEFGGSAKAAFDADPLAKYNKMMGSMKMAMGEAGLALVEAFQPALLAVAKVVKSVAEGIKDLVHWFKENENVGKALAVGLGVIAGLYVANIVLTKLMAFWTAAYGTAVELLGFYQLATAEGMGVLTAAQFALNAAMDVNPIGILIVGIGALVAGIVYLYESFAEVRLGFALFTAGLMAVWEIVKVVVDIMINHFVALKDIIVGVFTLDTDQIKKGIMSEADNVMSAGSRLADAAKKGWKKGMDDFAKDEKERGLGGVATKAGKAGKAGGLPKMPAAIAQGGAAATPKGKTTKDVSGTKNVTINVTIGNLINDFQIKTTNIQESTKAIHDKVVMALTSAVNDSQIVAGN